MMTTIIIALAVLIGGGASVGAENSVPGDMLYPVKVSMNESFRSAISVSNEAKAEWNARRVERRLEEATALSASGELNAEAKASLEVNLQKHIDQVEARIERLEADGKTEQALRIESKLEAALKFHEKILARLNATGDSKAFADELRAHIESTEGVRVKAEADIRGKASTEVKVAAEGRIGAAENVLAEVSAFIEKSTDRLGAEATAEAKAQLMLATQVLAQAKASLKAEAFADAFADAGRAHRLAQEAKLFIRARMELRVRTDVWDRFFTVPGSLNLNLNAEGKAGADVGEETTSRDEMKSENVGGLLLNSNGGLRMNAVSGSSAISGSAGSASASTGVTVGAPSSTSAIGANATVQGDASLNLGL